MKITRSWQYTQNGDDKQGVINQHHHYTDVMTKSKSVTPRPPRALVDQVAEILSKSHPEHKKQIRYHREYQVGLSPGSNWSIAWPYEFVREIESCMLSVYRGVFRSRGSAWVNATVKKFQETPDFSKLAAKQQVPNIKAPPPKAGSPAIAEPPVILTTYIADDTLAGVRQRHEKALASLDNIHSDIVEGFVYVICNQAFAGSLKIGSAIDYERRLDTFQTYDPHRRFEILYTHYCVDRERLEFAVHHALCDYRIDGEWFSCTVAKAIAAIQETDHGFNGG